MKSKKMLLTALLCALVSSLSGCADETSANHRTSAGNALYLKYLPVVQALYGSWFTEDQLSAIDSAFSEQSARLEGIFGNTAVSGKGELACITHDERYLQLCRYCPAANVLYEHKDIIHVNPILVITPMLRTYEKSQIDKENTGAEWQSGNAVVYRNKITFLTMLAGQMFGDADYTVGYSSSEDLYYLYLMDFSDDLYVISLYFRFDKDDIMTQCGVDYVICGGNTLCPEADGTYAGSCLSLEFDETAFIDKIYTILGDSIGACTSRAALVKTDLKEVHTSEQAYVYQNEDSPAAYQGSLWFYLTEASEQETTESE